MNDLSQILANWQADQDILESCQIKAMPGGMSGASIWRVRMRDSHYALRRWPTHHPSLVQLRAIHQGIEHVRQGGLEILPGLEKSLPGPTVVPFEGRLWELSSWLLGEPLRPCSATTVQRVAALQALGRFHVLAESFRPSSNQPRVQSAPGLKLRAQILCEMNPEFLALLTQSVQRRAHGAMSGMATELLDKIRRNLPQAVELVQQSLQSPLPVQWCLRDIHPGNLLFVGQEVSGIVDFGAAAIDSVAGDLARLMGGIGGDSRQQQEALAAYESIRPLRPQELRAMEAYHRGGLVCAAANWLRWLYLERTMDPDSPSVQVRLRGLSTQLACETPLPGASGNSFK